MKKTNSYNTWQDLLDDEETPLSKAASPEAPEISNDPEAGGQEVELPPDLLELMAEKDRLKKKLDALSGQAAPDLEEERFKKMYPVKVHTKESRIEERRLRKRDESLQMLRQRALEHRYIEQKAALSQAEQDERLRRQLLLKKRIVVEQSKRSQEQLELQRRKALEKSLIEQHFFERQRQAQAALIQHRKQEQSAFQHRDSLQKEIFGQKKQEQLLHQRWDSVRQRLVSKLLRDRKKEDQSEPMKKSESPESQKSNQEKLVQPRQQKSVAAIVPQAKRKQKKINERKRSDNFERVRKPVSTRNFVERRKQAREKSLLQQKQQRANSEDIRIERERLKKENIMTERIRAAQEQKKLQRLKAAQAQKRAEARALEERLDRPRKKRDTERFS